jgi:hypothetical protein
MVVMFAMALAYLPLVVAGLASVLASAQRVGLKLLWIFLILSAPLLGSIAWFLIGRTYNRRGAPGTA